MIMVRVIIAGGRDFDNEDRLDLTMNELFGMMVRLHPEKLEVVSGMARGADRLGREWAIDNMIAVKEMPADWDTYGKQAGWLRNNDMAEYARNAAGPGVLVAFWDGTSTGTKNMITLGLTHGLEVHVYRYDG